MLTITGNNGNRNTYFSPYCEWCYTFNHDPDLKGVICYELIIDGERTGKTATVDYCGEPVSIDISGWIRTYLTNYKALLIPPQSTTPQTVDNITNVGLMAIFLEYDDDGFLPDKDDALESTGACNCPELTGNIYEHDFNDLSNWLTDSETILINGNLQFNNQRIFLYGLSNAADVQRIEELIICAKNESYLIIQLPNGRFYYYDNTQIGLIGVITNDPLYGNAVGFNVLSVNPEWEVCNSFNEFLLDETLGSDSFLNTEDFEIRFFCFERPGCDISFSALQNQTNDNLAVTTLGVFAIPKQFSFKEKALNPNCITKGGCILTNAPCLSVTKEDSLFVYFTGGVDAPYDITVTYFRAGWNLQLPNTIQVPQMTNIYGFDLGMPSFNIAPPDTTHFIISVNGKELRVNIETLCEKAFRLYYVNDCGALEGLNFNTCEIEIKTDSRTVDKTKPKNAELCEPVSIRTGICTSTEYKAATCPMEPEKAQYYLEQLSCTPMVWLECVIEQDDDDDIISYQPLMITSKKLKTKTDKEGDLAVEIKFIESDKKEGFIN